MAARRTGPCGARPLLFFPRLTPSPAALRALPGGADREVQWSMWYLLDNTSRKGVSQKGSLGRTRDTK